MPNPFFSVIISTYNRKSMLPEAVQCVLNQTCRDFELIVIDNGSTDGSPKVMTQFKDPRIRFLINPTPTSSCDAPRNWGIQLARGTIISFLDDDDIWYPQKLEKVKNIFDHFPNIDAVCHNENRRAHGGMTQVLNHRPFGNDLFEHLLYDGNCLSTCAISIKKEYIQGFNGFNLNKDVVAVSDYDLWLRMSLKNVQIYYLNETLGEFRIHQDNGSITNPWFDYILASLIKKYMLGYEKKGLYSLSIRGSYRLLILNNIAIKSFIKKKYVQPAIPVILENVIYLFRHPSLGIRLLKKLSPI